MPKVSKRQKCIISKLTEGALYSVEDAVAFLKALPPVKFTQSVDVSIALGIDPRVSEQMVRGSAVMPCGTGKSVRIAVFAQGEAAESAKDAGADRVGFDDLASDIKSGKIDFDILIATPDVMSQLGKLGKVLGPRGLMPNAKVGTVAPDVKAAVLSMRAGQVQYRSEKGGLIHCAIGKLNFKNQALRKNLQALLDSLREAKPAASKGKFIKKVTISSTMGPGLVIDQSLL